MREELRQEQALVAPPPGPAAQQPRQILGPAQPEIVVELGVDRGPDDVIYTIRID